MSPPRPVVPLTIAGSDPSGGAGLQADLKVFLRFGLSGAAVPTAWTVQSPSGVHAVHAMDPGHLKAQLDALLRDVRPAAVKVGMLPDGRSVRAVARALSPLAGRDIPIVVDPVLVSSSGRRLLPEEDVATYVRLLVPLATLLTPNVDEAAELTGMSRADVRRDTEPVLRALLRKGARNVLVKGGHGGGQESVDILGTKEEVVLFAMPRVPRRRAVHGTGCALSAAICALLAQGAPLEDAIQLAKEFVTAAIKGARPIGRGSRQLDFTVPVAFEGRGAE
ncbi:MAG: bifunctional hydroxymethylpyrimidine kinase/phosphomethylpyrimidine kinase [Planctomycetes bacterium]|nr:bifunctional hydroxymethylpyrimidine kinase/phosphomethylpyrimidine kinase [Planctomycetota bacterium]